MQLLRLQVIQQANVCADARQEEKTRRPEESGGRQYSKTPSRRPPTQYCALLSGATGNIFAEPSFRAKPQILHRLPQHARSGSRLKLNCFQLSSFGKLVKGELPDQRTTFAQPSPSQSPQDTVADVDLSQFDRSHPQSSSAKGEQK
jgi:hypothetical protein